MLSARVKRKACTNHNERAKELKFNSDLFYRGNENLKFEGDSLPYSLSKRQFRCEFAGMRDAGFLCRVFSADDSKADGFGF